jgi:hypothetical protein
MKKKIFSPTALSSLKRRAIKFQSKYCLILLIFGMKLCCILQFILQLLRQTHIVNGFCYSFVITASEPKMLKKINSSWFIRFEQKARSF